MFKPLRKAVRAYDTSHYHTHDYINLNYPKPLTVFIETFITPIRRHVVTLRLVAIFMVITTALGSIPAFSEPSPDSQLFLDVSAGKVVLEAYIPVPELALVLGEDIQRSPETLAERYAPQLWSYMMKHIQAYSNKKHPWSITIDNIRMAKDETYAGTTIPYWELVVRFILTPQPHETTRTFTLYYDAVLHQVMNHAAIVSIRRDWEGGVMPGDTTRDASIIGWNLGNNTVPPLTVTLERGSWWNGFTSMFVLGMHHIREGTDHLLFLFTLLLAAPLVAQSRTWGAYGGLHYSIGNLVRIVTAFTLGHALTVAIGALGWIALPTNPIEILIAFSILVSAAHAFRPIIAGKEVMIAAGFGLIHGLAFAETLANLGLDTGAMIVSILAFNLGIEVMQLIIVALVMPWLLLLSRFPMYTLVRVGGAVFASIAAVGWMLEQLLNRGNLITHGMARLAQFFPAALILLALCAIVTTVQSGHLKRHWRKMVVARPRE